jgi:hypothetical protein
MPWKWLRVNLKFWKDYPAKSGEKSAKSAKSGE